MTRQEAIKQIRQMIVDESLDDGIVFGLVDKEALNIAMSCLKQNCEEAESNGEDAQPVVKTGRWVKARGSWCTPGGDPVWECSECGKGIHVYGIEHGTYGADVADGQWVACPNCGARMN